MAPTISQSCNLRIMIVYTPAVSSNVNNPLNLCQQSIDLLNQTFSNSGVNHTAELAYAGEIDYTETGDNDIDMKEFGNPNDGIIDQIHGMRDDYSADLCAIYTTSSSFLGISAAVYADESHVFCQVYYDAAVSNITFPHEIGHLLGARHNVRIDSKTNPFPYNHGYWIVTATSHFWPFLHYWGYRSVMCYDPSLWMNTFWSSYNVPKVPYWTSPNVTFNTSQFGTLTFGTSTDENNVSVLNQTIPDARTFRQSILTLVVNNQIFNNSIGNHIAQNITTSGNITIPTSTTINFQAGQSVILNDGFQSTAGSNFIAKIVSMPPCSGDPNAGGVNNGGDVLVAWDVLSLKSNIKLNAYPNPTWDIVNIEFEVRAVMPHIDIYDMNGKIVGTFNNSNFIIGLNKVEYNLSNLNSGTYFVKLAYGKDVYTLKIIYSHSK